MTSPRVVAGALALALCVSLISASPASASFAEWQGPASGQPATEVSWVVPDGVEVVQVILQGAGGGDGHAEGVTATAGVGGFGANIEVSIDLAGAGINVLEIGLGAPGGAGGVESPNEGGASPFGFGPGGRGGQVGAAGAAHFGGGGGGLSALRVPGRGYLLSAAGGGGGGSAVESNWIGVAQNPRGGAGGLGTSIGGPIDRTGSMWLDGRPGSPGTDPSDPAAGRGGTGGIETVDGQAPGIGGSVGGSNGFGSAGGAGGTNACSGGGGGAGWQGGGGGGGKAHVANWGCGGGGAGLSIFEGGNRTTSIGATSSAAFGQINWISFDTTEWAPGRVGAAYNQPIGALFEGDTTPNVWSVTPALPAGLTLDALSGEISGTPTAAGTGDYTVTASYERFDLGGLIARSSRTFSLSVTAIPVPPTPIIIPPSAPTDLRVDAGDAEATIAWSPPISQGSFTVSNYEAVVSPGNHTCLVIAPALSCTITGLLNDTTYTATVRALNGAGWGPPSAPSESFTPHAPPAPEVSLTITGSRELIRGRSGVVLTGDSTGLAGMTVRARVRLAGQVGYRDGATRVVAEDGTFTWQRSTRKRVFVYFVAEDPTVRSNRLVINAR
jgi:hypothetical protein